MQPPCHQRSPGHRREAAHGREQDGLRAHAHRRLHPHREPPQANPTQGVRPRRRPQRVARVPASVEGGDRERREMGDLTYGPKDILEHSHDFSFLFNRK